MAQHLFQTAVGAELCPVVQTFSAYPVQQHEAFHDSGLIITTLSLFDLYMPGYTLSHFQRPQRADQQRRSAKRR
jgi:hypothetical protein